MKVIFFQNTETFKQISKMLENFLKMLTVKKIIAFELAAGVSVNYDKNACERPSTC